MTKECKNKVVINLNTGTVEIASDVEPLNKCIEEADKIAKKLTRNCNANEWGIT